MTIRTGIPTLVSLRAENIRASQFHATCQELSADELNSSFTSVNDFPSEFCCR